MPIDRNDYYSYPRFYFADGIGRPFNDEEWDKFIMAMDKFALDYMKDLERELERKSA